MHPMLMMTTIVLLSATTVVAAESPPTSIAEAVPTPQTTVPQVASAPGHAWIDAQIQSRVAEHKDLVEQLTARALAGSVEERKQVQIELQEANLEMRLDILRIQLEFARTSESADLATKIEANMARLVEVSKTPQTALRTEKVARPTDRTPSVATKVEHPVSTRSSINEQGGNN